MLTRAQVAKRLGKSIATVRRMEGYLLYPEKDADGVHLFDADEVDDVARGYAQRGMPRVSSDWFDELESERIRARNAAEERTRLERELANERKRREEAERTARDLAQRAERDRQNGVQRERAAFRAEVARCANDLDMLDLIEGLLRSAK